MSNRLISDYCSLQTNRVIPAGAIMAADIRETFLSNTKLPRPILLGLYSCLDMYGSYLVSFIVIVKTTFGGVSAARCLFEHNPDAFPLTRIFQTN